jgi:predicted Zn-dependent peptidase
MASRRPDSPTYNTGVRRPQNHRIILGNGATLLVDEMRDVRSVALGFFVKTGSADESARERGISHFLEHLLFKRTRRRSAVRIAREIDRLGGDVDAFTTKEYTAFYAHTLDVHLPAVLDLLGDIVLAPAFGVADIEMERGVILEEIGEANDAPDDLVHELFVHSFWRSHPLSEPILGTAESVRSLRRGDLYRYYQSRYRPANMILSVAGHVRASEVVPLIERLFRRRGAARAAKPSRTRAPRPHQHCSVRPRKGLEQVHLCLGTRGPSQASERRYAAYLVDSVLGGGMSSRLFQEVREKRGLVYSIGSALNAYRLGGYETVYASCAPRNLVRVLDTTFRQLRKLKSEGIRPRELRFAQENLKGSVLLSLESTVSRMSAQARSEFYFGRVEPAEEAIGRIESLTVEGVSEVARDIFDGRCLSLSVVGNVPELPFSARDLAAAV